jgi:hypothetical protein
MLMFCVCSYLAPFMADGGRNLRQQHKHSTSSKVGLHDRTQMAQETARYGVPTGGTFP